MPEKKKQVKTYIIDYTCDKCKKGKLVATGLQTPPRAPKKMFGYICNNKKCLQPEMLPDKYPYLKYV